MLEIVEIFNTIYNLSPIPLRVSYGFWIALMIVYWYARLHDRYNVPQKPRTLDRRNFSAALPFVGIFNVFLYWLAELKKYPWHIFPLMPQEIMTVAGFVLMSAGLTVTLLGRAAINGYWGPHIYKYTRPEDRKLIQHGVYARVRHPIYFGQVLMAIGTFFFANTPTFLIFPLAVIVWNTARAKRETEFLLEHFGNEFVEYRKKTFRVIPDIY